MKCFDHHDRDAIGSCKSCQKGLCPECAVDLTHGLACKSRCEAEVENLIRLIQNNIKLSPSSFDLIKSTRKSGILAAAFYVVLGVLFSSQGMEDGFSFLTAMGICFVVYGVISLIRVLRLTA